MLKLDKRYQVFIQRLLFNFKTVLHSYNFVLKLFRYERLTVPLPNSLHYLLHKFNDYIMMPNIQ